MTAKEAYEKKLKAQLEQWDAEIDKLQAKAKQADADAQLEYHKRIEELQALRDKANQKLTELKNASENAWEDLKVGAELARDSLASAIKSATSRFKK
ncbi:MAG: coiled coil domain-containing protein [Desulfosudaceae bacterium]